MGVVLDAGRPASGPLLVVRRDTPRGAAALTVVLGEMIDEMRGQIDAIAAVGIGVPGLVDLDGTFRYGPNLPEVEGWAVASTISELTGLPTVADNDATCAAWGEHEIGAARGSGSSLCVTLGTGIGGGMTLDGRAQRGAHGFAGEPGHMVVDPAGPQCPCGRRGCWERFASGSGLGWLARRAVERGEVDADAAFVTAAGSLDAVRGEHVVVAARGGDARAERVLAEFGGWVGLGIANLVNVLDPEVVVIGGGVSDDADLFIDAARDRVASDVMGGPRRSPPDIRGAVLGARAGAVGAALLAGARALADR